MCGVQHHIGALYLRSSNYILKQNWNPDNPRYMYVVKPLKISD
jgi:hypothetical protein